MMNFLAKLVTFIVALVITIVQYAVVGWTIAVFCAVMAAFHIVVEDGYIEGEDLKNFLYFWYYPYILKK